MSDFLTRLAERSLGLAPTVRPRISSLFEPRPGEDQPAGPAPDDIAMVEGRPDEAPPARPEWPEGPVPGPAAPRRREAPGPIPRPDPAPTTGEPQVGGIDRPGPRQAAAGGDPMPAPPPSRPRTPDFPLAREGRTEPGARPSPGPAPGPEGEGEPAPSRRVAGAPGGEPRAIPPAGASLPSPPGPRAAREMAAIPKVVPLPGREEAAPRESPTIRVRIGRVEVRVVGPAPATPPAAGRRPAGPRLSLDDYLRDRGGAKQR